MDPDSPATTVLRRPSTVGGGVTSSRRWPARRTDRRRGRDRARVVSAGMDLGKMAYENIPAVQNTVDSAAGAVKDVGGSVRASARSATVRLRVRLTETASPPVGGCRTAAARAAAPHPTDGRGTRCPSPPRPQVSTAAPPAPCSCSRGRGRPTALGVHRRELTALDGLPPSSWSRFPGCARTRSGSAEVAAASPALLIGAAWCFPRAWPRLGRPRRRPRRLYAVDPSGSSPCARPGRTTLQRIVDIQSHTLVH